MVFMLLIEEIIW